MKARDHSPVWSIYVVRCRDGSLYTGIATDVARRVAEHAGEGARAARYLRGRGPLEIALARAVGTRERALRLEARVKRLPRIRKEELLLKPPLLDGLIAECRRASVPTRTSRSGRSHAARSDRRR